MTAIFAVGGVEKAISAVTVDHKHEVGVFLEREMNDIGAQRLRGAERREFCGQEQRKNHPQQIEKNGQQGGNNGDPSDRHGPSKKAIFEHPGPANRETRGGNF